MVSWTCSQAGRGDQESADISKQAATSVWGRGTRTERKCILFRSLACKGFLYSSVGLGRSPGEGKGYSLQYSGLESSMDCIVHGVAKSLTRLSDFNLVVSSRLPIQSGLRIKEKLMLVCPNSAGVASGMAEATDPADQMLLSGQDPFFRICCFLLSCRPPLFYHS